MYVLSYELFSAVPSPFARVAEETLKHGWDRWVVIGQDERYALPTALLIGQFDSMAAAETAFSNAVSCSVAAGYSVTVRKWFIGDVHECRFDSDVLR